MVVNPAVSEVEIVDRDSKHKNLMDDRYSVNLLVTFT